MIHFYAVDQGNRIVRPTWFNDEGDNFWYDIEMPFDSQDFFWYPQSSGYAKLYFIGEGYDVPSWVKQGCGW